jgi:hypothetical protein
VAATQAADVVSETLVCSSLPVRPLTSVAHAAVRPPASAMLVAWATVVAAACEPRQARDRRTKRRPRTKLGIL